jgi:hypothetical protein
MLISERIMPVIAKKIQVHLQIIRKRKKILYNKEGKSKRGKTTKKKVNENTCCASFSNIQIVD